VDGDAAGVAGDAAREVDQAKAALYQRLHIRLTYQPTTNSVRSEAHLGPDVVGIESVSEERHEPFPHASRS